MLAVSGDQQHPSARQVHAVNEDLIVDLPGDGRVRYRHLPAPTGTTPESAR